MRGGEKFLLRKRISLLRLGMKLLCQPTHQLPIKFMSENEEPKPMTKTSAVPIRKETVRVTLKAPPQGGTGPTAPPAPLTAPAPLTPPTGAVPTSPKPPTPAPMVPIQTPPVPSGVVPPAPAPTVRLQTGVGVGPATKLAAPAPTVRLNTPTGGLGTVPLATGSASQQLPKATVQLTQTQPMDSPSTPSQAATIRTADDDDSSSNAGEGAVVALSVVALVASLILLAVQLSTASIWVEGEWGKLFE